MHPFFEPLDERETMLLLTTLTVGSEETRIFDYLPAESKARLTQKAAALSSIPKEKRVAFIVHEMKHAFAFRGLRGVEKVDASWLLQGLKGESPRAVAAVLVGLPRATVRALLERLPPGIRQRLPPKEEMKRVPVELVRSLRQVFESRFFAMPQLSPKGFGYRDIIQLERSEIYKVMRDLGLIELGQAFVAVGKMALAELCRRLPREKAEELIQAVRGASRVDVPDLKSAQRFLSLVVVNFTDTEEFFQKAGLWRLAKAALIEDEGFRAAFRQRLPREAGQLFASLLEKASERTEYTEELVKRLQDSILLRVRELAKRGEVSQRWAEVEMLFHDPSVATPLPPPAPVEGGAAPASG